MLDKPVPNVLILGCGRSGTSIFGELFDHLKAYDYFSEPDFDSLYGKTGPVAVKVPRSSEKNSDTPGLSFPLEELAKTNDLPWKIFWIIRHPLDAVSSLKVGILRNWGHHPRPADWESWLDRSLISQCAHHWNYINSVGFEKIKETATVVKFEEMVLNPIEFSNRILTEVGGNTLPNKAELRSWCERVKNSPISAKEEAKTSRAYSTEDHKVKVDRWKENLSSKEVDEAVNLVKDTAIKFGYQL